MYLQLHIIQNENIIETVVKETKTELSALTTALEDFRQSVNSVFTEKILNNISADTISSGDESSSSDDEIISPKKQKK